LDKQDLLLTKQLITTYKERLEKEIIKRSNKLRIPQNVFQDIIINNDEIKELEKAIKDIELKSVPSQQIEE
tara:strand:- start:948 stop:1160 length:213 start_codon:yes stop_codon:yes gene_type:complete